MQYAEFVEVYEALSKTSGKIEKAHILSEFLKKLHKKGKGEWIYLLKGRVIPDYDPRELGISRQLTIKAIAKASGISETDVQKKFNKIGDLGEVAEELMAKKRQSTLFSSKLGVEKVFENLKKLNDIEGGGSVEKKLGLIAELLTSASGKEAKYIVRTLLSDLRIGIADGIIRDAVSEALFGEGNKDAVDKVGKAFDIAVDWAIVFKIATEGEKELDKIHILPGKPFNVMLAAKVADIEEGFKVCGKPAAIEHKYDGFRLVISKKGNEITLFTRRLENVTNQFPDVIEAVKKHVKGESFVLDAEAVGYDPKTKKYRPFEAISQRIKRKYEIEKLIEKLPIEVNIFDVVYYEGKNTDELPFKERRKIIEKIVKAEKWKIKTSEMIIAHDEEEAQKFYDEALNVGEEGIMIKNLNEPYSQGRRVGYMAKLKPNVKDLDLAIVGAEYGTGKRGGWLTSYILACRNGDELVEVGKVSSGLKEKEEEGTSYEEMTKLLKPLITGTEGGVVKVKPKLVVSVTYQNIQASPSYSSGYALRFPRITHYRPDRRIDDINTLHDIKKEAEKGRK